MRFKITEMYGTPAKPEFLLEIHMNGSKRKKVTSRFVLSKNDLGRLEAVAKTARKRGNQ